MPHIERHIGIDLVTLSALAIWHQSKGIPYANRISQDRCRNAAFLSSRRRSKGKTRSIGFRTGCQRNTLAVEREEQGIPP
jgi:hypothetical protein